MFWVWHNHDLSSPCVVTTITCKRCKSLNMIILPWNPSRHVDWILDRSADCRNKTFELLFAHIVCLPSLLDLIIRLDQIHSNPFLGAYLKCKWLEQPSMCNTFSASCHFRWIREIGITMNEFQAVWQGNDIKEMVIKRQTQYSHAECIWRRILQFSKVMLLISNKKAINISQ